jgi:membrane-bound serine protease (ClpP class)
LALALAGCLACVVTPARAAVWQIDVAGAIGPATADHMVRGLEAAAEAGSELVILRIDTPGGLDMAMREMIKAILASPVPVAAYVAPGGARAASAGTYLLYASHLAAMAPGTNLGAATPVQIASPGLPQIPDKDSQQDDGVDPVTPGTAMERKIINDAVAYIQSLAQLRGRNAEWAEEAVRSGSSLSAEDALELGVIELLAESTADLLAQLDGREVRLEQGVRVIEVPDSPVYLHPVDWRSEFLSIITDPNMAYVLMLIGIYGLIIEFYNPGFGLPGVVGAVCLVLAMYAFQVLPISYAGLGLILLGIALMTAEAFAPSFGILGLGGVVAFVIGSVMLMDTQLPGYQIAMPMIAAFALFSVIVLVVALGLILKSRRRALVTGVEHLLGMTAQVESLGEGIAWVRLDGELWEAQSDDRLQADDKVTVDAIDGLTLKVSKQGRGSSDV